MTKWEKLKRLAFTELCKLDITVTMDELETLVYYKAREFEKALYSKH